MRDIIQVHSHWPTGEVLKSEFRIHVFLQTNVLSYRLQ